MLGLSKSETERLIKCQLEYNLRQYKIISRMCVCSTLLEISKGFEPYSEEYYICPKCDSTYNINEFN